MISTIPPPRPVSVNSLARDPFPTPLALQKSTRCASAQVPIHDSSDDSQAHSDPGEGHFGQDMVMEDSQSPLLDDASIYNPRPELRFENLPVEIHEAILDHLFGERGSTLINASAGRPSSRSWVKALRHPRRKALSNLALISPVWRPLVQDRIYRHIKVKGTSAGLAECAGWFRAHPHLVPYVRHIEVWVPVWGRRAIKSQTPQLPPSRRYINEDLGIVDVAAVLQATMAGWDESDTIPASTFSYQLSSHNATLQEIFCHVKTTFPDARILTLEGGHCKKPPMIRHFKTDPWGRGGNEHLDVLPNVQTFVMRGAWNIMREYQHWRTLSEALPSLREWHCSYAKPKAEGYDTIARVLSNWTSHLQHVNISLDGFYNKDLSESHLFFGENQIHDHLCRLLGDVAPLLESLAFTGKLCSCLFDAMQSSMARKTPESRLQSLDLVVKSCCREEAPDPLSLILDDASGITNLKFIKAFEKLVIGAVASLEKLPTLDYVRVRFIDLDSACPLLNPYFQLVDKQCTGLWSPEILETLQEARPAAYYVELADGIYPQYGLNNTIVGAIYPRNRPLSINANMYKIIADASKA